MSPSTPKKNNKRNNNDFDQKILDVARITRVVAGGRRFRFRVAVVIGNRRGNVGFGIAKGADVANAVEKAVARAKKNCFEINLVDGTILHEIREKFKAAIVLLKPAKEGRGIIAGGPVRAVVEMVGIRNIVSKMLGSQNKVSNARATLNALKSLEKREDIAKRRGRK